MLFYSTFLNLAEWCLCTHTLSKGFSFLSMSPCTW